ncbi:hypothetical protein DIE04_05055 [Burkholderia sp. Bp8994]|nr:hypothetical protein DIE20_07245 [Burkholderia sp. Bp9131]RQR69641.1 hypothetical protein DIE12_22870 [Burkholderia sp. Bp9015]RQR78264.1 hypothetical protein DIE10_23900 [Burkholderia sp. Bp9011]RQR88501.1 hypothetical protein DIE09_25990 [Burkholderia sp. Bp9010]RQS00395.1 hypothetical protein DIE04_05055 [Burkholderia sp. Bp8994]RQS02484.1 hypothetical protein DIE02_23095 [Burkholderia sp. Bp8991]RQS34155.1 hypothetical protein DIE05_02810 [Burkholderia sp. Bp8995]RQS43993.1 hypothetic
MKKLRATNDDGADDLADKSGTIQPVYPARFRSVTVRSARYLFIIKAILKDSKVVVCWIVKAFARTSASSS